MSSHSIGVLLWPDELEFMGFDRWNGGSEITSLLSTASDEAMRHINNAGQRIAEVRSQSSTLDAEVIKRRGQSPREGQLFGQFCRLLTCADVLGHIYVPNGKPGKRFKEFFARLPGDVKQRLVNSFLAWETSEAEMIQLGLVTADGKGPVYPKPQQVSQYLQPLTLSDRLGIVVDYFYAARNLDTHEADYPQLGHHPGLSVLQGLRLKVPYVGSLGNYDHLQMLRTDDALFFVYMMSDDPIAELKCVILKGLEGIIRSFGPNTAKLPN